MEYKWSIADVEEMESKAVIAHFCRLREYRENEIKTEFARMRFLVTAIHSDPQALLDGLEQMGEPKNGFDEEIGDVQLIRARGGRGRHGRKYGV